MSLLLTLCLSSLAAGAAEPEVNLYSYRTPALMQPLLDAFTKETGIRVNVVHAEKGLLERLRAEGANSPADLVLTADIGNLNDLVEAGLLQPVASPVLAANIPPHYRDPDQRWYGLSMRGRVILAAKDRVAPGTVTTYAALADPQLKGRVCSRSGKHVYMISLIAAQIAHSGESATETWLKGIKANLAKKPQGNDRAQVKAIAEGECDVALVNTYYLGLMQTGTGDPAERQWADAVRPIFPDQQGAGTHWTGRESPPVAKGNPRQSPESASMKLGITYLLLNLLHNAAKTKKTAARFFASVRHALFHRIEVETLVGRIERRQACLSLPPSPQSEFAL